MLRNLERERSELLLEEEVLKMQVAEAQALAQLESDTQINAMVQVKGAEFTAPDSTVARRENVPD